MSTAKKGNGISHAYRRINHLRSVLAPSSQPSVNFTSSTSSPNTRITIGKTSIPSFPSMSLERVPPIPLVDLNSQEILEHLSWMIQKDLLKQDIFLIGPPGPFKRHLALSYLNLVNREAEYLCMHRDTSAESDIKQRREIERGPTGAKALWVDGVAVRAALEGRVLVIEGIEKAERNVLPVLNNLLENRELNLEDGRHIIHPSRYDQLLKSHSRQELQAWNLVRASENFRVIALGTPVPPYPGNPLDPPFRSRFQVRYCDYPVPRNLGGGAPGVSELLKTLGQVIQAIKYSHLINTPMSSQATDSVNLLPMLPQTAFQNLMNLANYFPDDLIQHPTSSLARFWPSSWVLKPIVKEQQVALVKLLRDCGVEVKQSRLIDFNSVYSFGGLKEEASEPLVAFISFKGPNGTVTVRAPKGPNPLSLDPPVTMHHPYVSTPKQTRLLTAMLQAHSMQKDIALTGPPASGKSLAIHRFARMLGYEVDTVHLYRDMTARDLLQRRGTRADGSTYWQNSGLVDAALTGRLAILDGVQWLGPGTIAAIQRLVQDREIVLPDGCTLKDAQTFDFLVQKMKITKEELESKGILRIHPSFRIIATATVSEGAPVSSTTWMNEEISTMFNFIRVDPIDRAEEELILNSLQLPIQRETLTLLLTFAEQFRASTSGAGHHLSKTASLSTRQLIRVMTRVSSTGDSNDVRGTIRRSCLAPFLPTTARKALEGVLDDVGVGKSIPMIGDQLYIRTNESHLDIAGIKLPLHSIPSNDEESKSLIPSSDTSANGFMENPLHVRCLRDMAIDFGLGEHLLIIGNQGVGKNKLTDRFLELLKRPREYIQLHRDTTVASLTISASVENGVIVYSDSPLIRAVKKGRVIVIDEADKAPITITATLKSLAESGEMSLADGRKIRPHRNGVQSDPLTVEMHPDFRMIILANRPGFPFMGNDFFSTIGEVFSCHPIENPDPDSEFALLSQVAPSVSPILLRRLIAAFNDLRAAFDDNLITYPYSLRELLNLVRHLERFGGSEEKLGEVLRNVFDFDVHRSETVKVLRQAFQRHGFSLSVPELGFDAIYESDPDAPKLELKIEKMATNAPPDALDPKHGKVDEKNDPHIGGNQWAGGTGGSDTAGLGGRGGPYRLDSGHPVHQLSDEEKAKVPPEVLKRARALGKQALEARLKEIKMSEVEGDIYREYSGRVRADVVRMKVVLEGVRDRKSERQWIRNRSEGELDDGKLVEGIIGEKAIYKYRGEEDPEYGMEQGKPKRLKLVFDVSGSMYRFNGHDGRLTRCLETALMIMESLEGMEDKYRYDIVGHSGDSECIEFVPVGKPPKNELERLKVLQNMAAHAQYCWSGDTTVAAAAKAIKDVVEEDADDHFVIILSDANLRRYGIHPSEIAKILDSDEKVNAAMIFIGSLGEEAKILTKALPRGKAFVAMQTKDVPAIMKDLFSVMMER
ncbi:hypothetical protein HDU97_000673 [Phlyctochytrium planicorne]|nr:hypothetical protein HDU97_000673 [Phlyctochytrium planicorne]